VDKSAEVLVWMAAFLVAGLTATAVYRWRLRRRAGRVRESVKDYLVVRYGSLPNRLTINCSDDPLWPVLAVFDGPGPGSRHRLQFASPRPGSVLRLLSEDDEPR
jgi:hypothetical protein